MAAASEVQHKPLKLVVFGATGGTGLLLVQQALDKGHHVTAIVRTPEKMNIKHDNLEVVKADIFDVEDYAPSFEGKDAVMSAFGTAFYSIFNPTTLYSESMKGIIDTMKRYNVQRLVVCTSAGTQATPGGPFVFEWIIKPLILDGMLKDMGVMERMVEQEDWINYTFVRPAQLLDGPAKGDYKIDEGYCNMTGTTRTTPRADVAACMLMCLETTQYDRKGIAIATIKE